MSTALRKPMTRDAFFAWAQAQEEPYEFDGFEPVAMTGGLMGHSRMIGRLNRQLGNRLDGKSCETVGPEAGIATVGNAVRYPDAVITCSPVEDNARLVPNPVIVFEVISPTSIRTDRIVKLREYQAVPSIRRYIIIETDAIAVTVFSRDTGGAPFIATGLGEEDTIELPEAGIAIPVAVLYAAATAPQPPG